MGDDHAHVVADHLSAPHQLAGNRFDGWPVGIDQALSLDARRLPSSMGFEAVGAAEMIQHSEIVPT